VSHDHPPVRNIRVARIVTESSGVSALATPHLPLTRLPAGSYARHIGARPQSLGQRCIGRLPRGFRIGKIAELPKGSFRLCNEGCQRGFPGNVSLFKSNVRVRNCH